MSAARLHFRLCDDFGVTYPIFGFSHSADVVVAVCQAGGIGIWGGTRNTPDEIASTLAGIASQVEGRPFGIDLVLPQGMPQPNNREEIEQLLPPEHRDFVDELWTKYDVPNDGQAGAHSRFVRSQATALRQVEVVLDSEAGIFAMGGGSPPEFIAEAKRRGKTMVSLVGQPRHAEKALAAGRAFSSRRATTPGRTPETSAPFCSCPRSSRWPATRRSSRRGASPRARRSPRRPALGAVGVWMGTAWLLTDESALEPAARRQLAAAQSTDTVITRSDSGKTLRVGAPGPTSGRRRTRPSCSACRYRTS